jgi:hypothetical protein
MDLQSDYQQKTKRWVEQVVIGMNLCPFAAKPFQADLIRYVVTSEKTPMALMGVFLTELNHLVSTPAEKLETTLLIHPDALQNFEAYLDFFAEAEDLLNDSGASELIQLASFHPHYQFANTEPNDVSNYTNRSPYPMIHLIRAESVERARHSYPDIEEIPARNIRLMEAHGLKKMQGILKKI